MTKQKNTIAAVVDSTEDPLSNAGATSSMITAALAAGKNVYTAANAEDKAAYTTTPPVREVVPLAYGL